MTGSCLSETSFNRSGYEISAGKEGQLKSDSSRRITSSEVI
jgi:hypothetical protein